MENGKTLRQLLSSGETLVMPDAFDPITARMIEDAGFAAVQCSGGSISIAKCQGSETELTLEQNLIATAEIINAVSCTSYGRRRGWLWKRW